MEDYRDVNRANWDERVAAHAASPDYAVARFTDDPSFLSEVVSVRPCRGSATSRGCAVHLQCHIGTDTVSLARLGAQMTGLDFSAPALEQGRAPRRGGRRRRRVRRVRSLRRARGARPRALRSRLHRHRGALLAARHPPLGRGRRARCCGRAAASSSARATRCCGRSPSRATGRAARASSTRTSSRPSRWSGTRAAPTSRPTSCSPTTSTHEWNHGLGEIVTAVLAAGLELTALEEHDTRAVGRAARSDDRRSAAASTGSPTGPSGCRTRYTLQARRPG